MKAVGRLLTVGIAAILTVSGVNDLNAQYLGGGTKTFAETQVADLEQLRDKFVALAGAFPQETYGWRPMEGVRSVHDVMALIAAETVQFPGMWGYEAPAWVAEGGFGAELQRLGALNKEQVISEIERGFEFTIDVVRNMSDADREREVTFFGLTVPLGTAVMLMMNDMHEHLGQSIAYARMNQIVPPWSRRN